MNIDWTRLYVMIIVYSWMIVKTFFGLILVAIVNVHGIMYQLTTGLPMPD